MNFRSVKTKIAVLSGLCLLLSAASVVGVGLYFSKDNASYVQSSVTELLDKKTKEYMQNMASTQAGYIRSEFDVALQTARTMADNFGVIAGSKSRVPSTDRRAHLNDILLETLRTNKQFNGTYTAWLPNALDGDDDNYRNRRETGTDQTGRFLSYWTRDDKGHIGLQTLVEYDSEELHKNGIMKGGWFISPQRTGVESVLGPLPYIVQGKQVYLATLSVPIVADSKFLGVAGTDFNLDFVQKLAGQVSSGLFGGKNEVTILSDRGLVVASSSHPETIGSSYASSSETWTEDMSTITGGKESVAWHEKSSTLRIFSPIKLGQTGKPWSVLITVPKDVVMAEANKLSAEMGERNDDSAMWQIIMGLCVSLVALLAMWGVARSIGSPIIRMTSAMHQLAEGNLNVQVPAQGSADEIGQMAEAVQVFKNNAIEVARLKEDQANKDREAAETKRKTMDALANEFEQSVGQIVAAVASAATELQANAKNLNSLSDQTSSQATNVSTATESTSSNVQTAAAAAEELSASIGEINRQVEESSRITKAAVEEVSRTDVTVSTLSEAATQIGDVVKLIQDIASQTNLLALNATIEAARAGEAGKGFAVVASEVKNLASQTAKATEEIGKRIITVQDVSNETVSAIRSIGTTIQHVSEISGIIANAVQQQTSATQDISNNVQLVSRGTSEVSSSIGDVTRAARESRGAADEVLSAANELSHEAENLRGKIDSFLSKVRQS